MKRWKKNLILGFLLLPLLLLIGLPVGLHCFLKHRVAAYRAELLRQGEKLDIADIIPPSPTNGPNGAADFLVAAGVLDETYALKLSIPSPAIIVPGRALVVSRRGEWLAVDGTNQWPLLLTNVAVNRATLDDVRAALRQPALQFSINYYMGFNARITHLPPARKAAQQFRYDALVALHDNRLDAAHDDLLAMWRIAQSLEDERMLISQLVRIAILNTLHGVTWEYLEYSQVTDTQLAEWQLRWASLPVFRPGEMALNCEMAISKDGYDQLRRDPTFGGMMGNPSWNDPLEALRDRMNYGFFWPYFTSYRSERDSLEMAVASMQAVRRLQQTNSWLLEKQTLDQLAVRLRVGSEARDTIFPDPIGANTFDHVLKRLINLEAMKRITVTAIALRRYHRQQGRYPRDLAALVPEFLAVIPLDPVDAQPLRYRLEADGSFTLYSIGENGQDDQGNARPSAKSLANSSRNFNWLQGKDWVWPQPATPEQIKVWAAKEPKKRP